MEDITLYFCLALLLAVLVVVVLAIQLGKANKKNNAMQLQLSRLEGQVYAQQLSDIDNKLNPHLFKNVLNAIQSHAYQTYHSLDSLSSVLDYILYESKKQYVTPQQEIAFALSLIEIYRIKLSPLFELKVKKKINENEPLYHQHLMTPMVSIDLIENAFKHADLQSPNAFISITFEFKENNFMLTVANKISNKQPLKKEKQGLGGKILEQRLQIIYKENYKLDKFIENDVYITHLKINLLEHKAKMLAAR
ncbi:histidine kinase [Sphingobacterium psychroaquaticum]|uniref:Histidine kinase n=1 Tax=Sphingobacterium psychroaquaticum TaxID=561061 RepID=A0A1X7I0A1_9SPHI|nr:histidine kinase [Sphingobacterium psychroaquaticum]SMG07736.1 Histidine kinase [Sphingobacterium psychroaquaticum]